MHANVSLSRLPALFKQAGIASSGLAFKGRILLKTNALENRFLFPDGALVGSMKNMAGAIASAQQHCKPDLIISNDEVFLKNLLRLRKNLESRSDKLNDAQRAFLALLNNSLLEDENLYLRENSLKLAKEAGFSIPEYFTADTHKELREKSQEFGYPYFLKRNFEGGGMGVSHITADEDLERFIVIDPTLLNAMTPQNPILGQRQTTGTEYHINYASWQGELLGFDVIQPLQTGRENGPSSVVQTAYRPDWEGPLKALIQSLGYTGFGGLDIFEKAPGAAPEVIEVNLRPTNSLQMVQQLNSALIEKFSNKLKSAPSDDDHGPVHVDHQLIATIFPDEVFRDKNSLYASTTPTNIPWNDPGLLQEFLAKLNIRPR